MPPVIALIICVVVVAVLLCFACKQMPKVSFALWIPIIWMLLIASKPLGIWFTTSVADIESGSPIDRAFLSVLLCLGLIILAKRKFSWTSAIQENPWLTLWICYMLVSILWSDIPFMSLKRWVRELVAVVMAFLVATEPDPRKALECLFRRTIYILIPFSILLINIIHTLELNMVVGRGGRCGLVLPCKRIVWSVVYHCSVFFLFWSLVRRLQERDSSGGKLEIYADVIVLITTLWLLKGPPNSYPATAVVALAAGIVIFLGLRWIKKISN